MVDRVLVDTLTLQARDFAVQWKNRIRASPHLKHYNGMSDEVLVNVNMPLYPHLARTLDRGLDRVALGGFFAALGKERMAAGFPVSEVIYGINLTQQSVIDYLLNDFAPDSSMRMYQAMGALSQAAEFFLLGCFYITKGFLEATYMEMNKKDAVSEILLKKYFKDDFFFKD